MLCIVVFAWGLSMNAFRFLSFTQVDIFITIIGLAYGLIAAFTINNVWERFGKIRDSIAEETASLVDMYNILSVFGDKRLLAKVKREIVEYCQHEIRTPWSDHEADKIAGKKFEDVFEMVVKTKVETPHEEILFEECLNEMRDVSSARTRQMILARTRLSKIQWGLLLFLSVTLIGAVTFLEMPIGWVSIFISTSVIATVVLIIMVIYELNSLHMAEREVSEEPFEEVIYRLEKNH